VPQSIPRVSAIGVRGILTPVLPPGGQKVDEFLFAQVEKRPDDAGPVADPGETGDPRPADDPVEYGLGLIVLRVGRHEGPTGRDRMQPFVAGRPGPLFNRRITLDRPMANGDREPEPMGQLLDKRLVAIGFVAAEMMVDVGEGHAALRGGDRQRKRQGEGGRIGPAGAGQNRSQVPGDPSDCIDHPRHDPLPHLHWIEILWN
jgi:hypothetical protein